MSKEPRPSNKLLYWVTLVFVLQAVGWFFFIRLANQNQPQDVPLVVKSK